MNAMINNQLRHIHYCHDFFCRDKPELLVKIHAQRRHNTSSSKTKDSKEAEALKGDIESMKEYIETTSKQVKVLRSLVIDLTSKLNKREQNKRRNASLLSNEKRRRISLDTDDIPS